MAVSAACFMAAPLLKSGGLVRLLEDWLSGDEGALRYFPEPLPRMKDEKVHKPKAVDLWKPVPPLAPPEPIARAADDVIAGKLDSQFIVDPIQGGAGTSINMNTNEVIANRALELLGERKGNYAVVSPNSHVNMAQSTNDAFPTGVHLAALDLGRGLVAELQRLHDAFAAKEKEFTGLIKMGRTHIQDAVPIRLGQEFGAYAAMIASAMKPSAT